MQVIISDASVAGEGEHKIMDYIRRARSNPGYDANTKHVIYGLVSCFFLLSSVPHLTLEHTGRRPYYACPCYS